MTKKTTKAPVQSLAELPAQAFSARNFIPQQWHWFRKFWGFARPIFSIFSKNRFAILLENFKIGLVKSPKYSQPVSLSDNKISLRKKPGAGRLC